MQLPQRLLKFLPNLRTEKPTAKSGYTWGKEAQESNILRMLDQIGHKFLGQGGQLEDGDIVAERWLVSDDRALGSVEAATGQSLWQLLEEDGEQILGPQHWQERGPFMGAIMKHLDTHQEGNRGSLSVQVHPRPGHPTRPAKPEMWVGQGQVYLGFKEDMDDEAITQAWRDGKMEELLHAIELTPDKLVLVKGGLIHAIRANSFLYEWSMAPGREDIEKGNLKDCTVSPYDRTDGKTPRVGKEDLPASLRLLRESEGLAGVKQAELFTQPQLVYEDEAGNKIERLFMTDHVFVNRWTIQTQMDLKTLERGFPIFLDKGALTVEYQDGHGEELVAGEERLVPYFLNRVKVINRLSSPAIMYQWYAPLSHEK